MAKEKRKGPPNTPAVGEMCKLRGKSATGVVARINDANLWTLVNWDSGSFSRETPRLCHLYELEKVVPASNL